MLRELNEPGVALVCARPGAGSPPFPPEGSDKERLPALCPALLSCLKAEALVWVLPYVAARDRAASE